MTPPLFLGIDQSYGGFAMTLYWPETETHETLVRAFDPNDYTSQGARLTAVRDHVNEFLNWKGSPWTTAMEGYSMGSKFGREKLGELGGVTKMTLDQRGLTPFIAQPSTLKKFVLGAGAGRGKNLVLLSVFKKWGIDFNDDNAADSYALARLAHFLTYPALAQHKYEQEVVKTVLKEGQKK